MNAQHARRIAGLALPLLLTLAPDVARADVSLAGWMAHSPDDISGFATLSGDNAVVDVTLPFAVTIEGTSYATATVSTNGWIEFGGNTGTGSDPTNDCLPTAAHTHPFLAAYWDDMQTHGTNIRYGTVGSGSNRTFIVDFELDVVAQGSDDVIAFQVQVHQTSNLIAVKYRAADFNADGQSATIGFQGAGGSAATLVQPLTCNGKVLDDDRPDEGWSIDAARPGVATLAALMAHSPNDLTTAKVPGLQTFSGNDAATTVTLPFSVSLEGTSYTTLAISTNGWLEFGGNTAGSSDPTNDCLPTAAHTHPLIAAYWDDLDTFGTNIRYGTVGTSPNRTFIVDYQVDVDPANEGGSADDISFQVEIHEKSNLINVKYRDAGNLANGQGATIGFQGAGGAGAKAYPLTCNGKVLDDNQNDQEGWSVHPKASGAMALHAVMASSPDDITGFTTLSGNDTTATVTLPFNMVIDGTSYGRVALSTNGWLELGGDTSGGSDPTNDCLPTAAHTNPFIAAYWDDLQTQQTNVRYGTVGTSPDRTFIADYVLDVVAQGSGDVITFQVEMHETSNVIAVKYGEADVNADGQSATIGFQGAGGASAIAHPLTCNGKILDDNRPITGWSVAPLPLCGNGIVEPLGGEQCDQGDGNGSPTSCCTATCQFRTSGAVCRPGGGPPCDLSETCTGTSGSCPTDDAPTHIGVTCRLGSGDVCDPDETCNGSPGVACPADAVTGSGTVCRGGSGDVCDPAETCSGVPGQPCPANVVNGPTTVCRVGSGDGCDRDEVCSGLAAAPCPTDDAALNTGVVCRVGSGDGCDQNERCTGVPRASCPPDDAPTNAGVVCRPSSVDGAFCDESERCTGVPGATCPPNDAPGKINLVCRHGSGDACDPDERCTGIAGQGCPPDVVANPTVVCRAGSGDTCDPTERCPGIPGEACPADVVAPAGTVCRSANGACDAVERCTGSARAVCPADAFATAGTPCDLDQNVCTVDACDGHGACAAGGPLDCEDGYRCTQDSCDPVLGCVSTGTPSTTCVSASRASLKVRDSLNDLTDSLKFSWKGGPVLLADMGQPLETTPYELCIYDTTGVKMAMGVPAGPGWWILGAPSAPRGYQYKDRAAAIAGIRQIKLQGSSLPRASLKLQAKGERMPDPMLPFHLPVTAQLYAGDQSCWEAAFGPTESRNGSATFVGKSSRP